MSDSTSDAKNRRSPRPAVSPHRFAMFRIASWTMLDQILSTLTNIVLVSIAGRTVDRAAFGAFMTAMVVFNLGIGVERALISQPMSLRYTSHVGRDLALARARSLGTALGVGLVGSAIAIPAGLLIGGRLRDVLMAVGVVMPLLMMQDAVRLIYFASSQSKLAALNDALWALVQFTGMAIYFAVDTPTPTGMTLVWGGSAGVCVVVALLQMRVWPRLTALPGWVAEHRDISGYLVAEYALGTGAFQGGILAVGALAGGMLGSAAGLVVVGALRAGLTILGPLNMVATAMQSFAIPQLSRRSWMSQRDRRKVALYTSAFMVTVTLVYGALILQVPDSLGQQFLGDTWQNASAVLLPMVIGNAFWAIWQGPMLVLYAMGLARRAFWIMVVEAPMVFPLMIGGMYLGLMQQHTAQGAAVGAAWGQTLVFVSSLPLWIWVFRRVMQRPAPVITPAAGTMMAPSPSVRQGSSSARNDHPAATRNAHQGHPGDGEARIRKQGRHVDPDSARSSTASVGELND